MKNIILIGLSFFAAQSFAAPATAPAKATTAATHYDMQMEIKVDGQHVSSPRITSKSGEMASITQETKSEKTFVEVIATEGDIQGEKGIMMNFVVGYIKADGTRQIVSRPSILAKENELASIEVGKKGKPTLEMTVIAQRKSL